MFDRRQALKSLAGLAAAIPAFFVTGRVKAAVPEPLIDDASAVIMDEAGHVLINLKNVDFYFTKGQMSISWYEPAESRHQRLEYFRQVGSDGRHVRFTVLNQKACLHSHCLKILGVNFDGGGHIGLIFA